MKHQTLFSNKNLFSYLLLTFVFIIISYLSILYIYHHLSNKNAVLTLNVLNPAFWFTLIILLFLFYLLDSLRLYYILKTVHVHINFRYMFKLTFINIFISNITPFATGGGFAQIYFLNKKGAPIGAATAATTMRTILPIIFFFITTPIILLFNKQFLVLFSNLHPIFIALLALVYILIAYGFYQLIKNPKILKYIFGRTIDFLSFIHLIKKNKLSSLKEKFYIEIDSFSMNLNAFFTGRKINILLSVFLTLIYLLVLFLFPVVLLYGLGYHINALTIISIQIIITFMTYFAPTPGATGVAEGGFSLIFSTLVLKKDLVFLTFTWRFFTMYLGVILGLFVFYYETLLGSKHKRSDVDEKIENL